MLHCFYCGERASFLCDYPDCDRPICAGHTRRIGFVCYRARNKRLSDTVDCCTTHDDWKGDYADR